MWRSISGVHRNPLKNLASEERKQAVGNFGNPLWPAWNSLCRALISLRVAWISLRLAWISLAPGRGQFRDRGLDQPVERLRLLGKPAPIHSASKARSVGRPAAPPGRRARSDRAAERKLGSALRRGNDRRSEGGVRGGAGLGLGERQRVARAPRARDEQQRAQAAGAAAPGSRAGRSAPRAAERRSFSALERRRRSRRRSASSGIATPAPRAEGGRRALRRARLRSRSGG